MRSAKLHQNLRAGVETRPYNGAPRTPPPPRSNCIIIFQSERSRPFPTIFHYSFFIIHPFTGRRVVAPYARISVCPFLSPPQTPILIRCLPSVQTIPAFLRTQETVPLSYLPLMSICNSFSCTSITKNIIT